MTTASPIKELNAFRGKDEKIPSEFTDFPDPVQFTNYQTCHDNYKVNADLLQVIHVVSLIRFKVLEIKIANGTQICISMLHLS